MLYLTEDVDEFALQMLQNYAEKDFCNVATENLDLATEEEKEALKSVNEENKALFAFMQESIGEAVHAVRFTNTLREHPVCLSSEGALSLGMEKTLSHMPGAENAMKAELVLEINSTHPIAARLKKLFEEDKDTLASYSKILYANARLISGLSLDNASEFGNLICNLMLD